MMTNHARVIVAFIGVFVGMVWSNQTAAMLVANKAHETAARSAARFPKDTDVDHHHYHRHRHRRFGGCHRMIAPQQLGSFEPLVRSDDTSAMDDVSTVPPPRPYVKCIDWTTTTRTLQSSVATTTQPTQTRTVEFTAAWQLQKQLLQHHVDRLLLPSPPPDISTNNNNNKPGTYDDDDDESVILDALILVEHSPVYTLGTGSDASFIKQHQPPPTTRSSTTSSTTLRTSRIPIVRMDRGGEVTYHGPGQLTIYPVLDLRNYRQDIHWYIRALEEVVLVALNHCGVSSAVRQAGVTGIWVNDTKVAAVGISCKKWITQHGVAINVTPESLAPFDGIVPCGLVGRHVGCVNQFLPPDQHVTVSHMAQVVQAAMAHVFQLQLVVDDNDHGIGGGDTEEAIMVSREGGSVVTNATAE